MIWGENPLFLETSISLPTGTTRHWSQDCDVFEFCGALSALKPWGLRLPQLYFSRAHWNDYPLLLGGIQKLPDTKMCCKAKVIQTSYLKMCCKKRSFFWRVFSLGNFGAWKFRFLPSWCHNFMTCVKNQGNPWTWDQLIQLEENCSQKIDLDGCLLSRNAGGDRYVFPTQQRFGDNSFFGWKTESQLWF